MKNWKEVFEATYICYTDDDACVFRDGWQSAMAECELEIKQLKNQITNMKLKGATEAYYQMKGKENG